MSEQIFFNQGNVKVTNARFIVNSQTYAMSGVTSVKTGFAPPNRNGAFGAIIVGVLIALGADGATKLVGVLMGAAGIWYLTQLKNTHSVYLSSASGEVQALSDTDETYIGNVVEALNEALIHLG